MFRKMFWSSSLAKKYFLLYIVNLTIYLMLYSRILPEIAISNVNLNRNQNFISQVINIDANRQFGSNDTSSLVFFIYIITASGLVSLLYAVNSLNASEVHNKPVVLEESVLNC